MKKFIRKQAVLLVLVLLMSLHTTGIYGAEEAYMVQEEQSAEAEGEAAEPEGGDTQQEEADCPEEEGGSEDGEQEAPCEETTDGIENPTGDNEETTLTPETYEENGNESETEIPVEYTDSSDEETGSTVESESPAGPGAVSPSPPDGSDKATESMIGESAEEESGSAATETDEDGSIPEGTESESTASETATPGEAEPYYRVTTPKVTLKKVGDGIVGTAEIECTELGNFTEGMELSVMLGTGSSAISDGTEELELEIYSSIGGIYRQIHPGEKAGSFSAADREPVRLRFILPREPEVAGDFFGSVTFTYIIEEPEENIAGSGDDDGSEEGYMTEEDLLENCILENDLI